VIDFTCGNSPQLNQCQSLEWGAARLVQNGGDAWWRIAQTVRAMTA
jgi:hypothetical protein